MEGTHLHSKEHAVFFSTEKHHCKVISGKSATIGNWWDLRKNFAEEGAIEMVPK